MKIVVFDTETTNLEKPFCYNIGYAIFNTDTQECLIAKDFVVEQVWHNKALFETAYYAEKPLTPVKETERLQREEDYRIEKYAYSHITHILAHA